MERGDTDVDEAVVVVEAGRLGPADRAVLALIPAGMPVVAAVNKVDKLSDRAAVLPFLAELAAVREFAVIVPISASPPPTSPRRRFNTPRSCRTCNSS